MVYGKMNWKGKELRPFLVSDTLVDQLLEMNIRRKVELTRMPFQKYKMDGIELCKAPRV